MTSPVASFPVIKPTTLKYPSLMATHASPKRLGRQQWTVFTTQLLGEVEPGSTVMLLKNLKVMYSRVEHTFTQNSRIKYEPFVLVVEHAQRMHKMDNISCCTDHHLFSQSF